jgi:hypothetical protein
VTAGGAPAALLVAFALLVGAGVHGFSLAMWHGVVDGGPPDEVLLGQPREIRSDDWKVHLPLALAQRVHEPPFPLENRLVGLGQSSLLPIVELPIAHPLVVFRPTTWGFFLGPDAGLAWLWWSRVLGLFAVWFGVLRVLARGRGGLAAIGALAVAGAPFFQFWSFNAAPHAAAAGAVFLAAVSLARARRPAAIVASGAALGFAGACFALAVYPPYQVTLAWLVVALLAGFALELRGESAWRSHAGLRVLAAAGAAVVALAAVAVFVVSAREAIEALQQTVYPGRRLATGGSRTLAQLANATLAAGLWAEQWGPLRNACEAASFWLLAPAPVALWVVRWLRGEPVDPVAAALLVYLAALVTFAVVGVPAWLARASGLSLVPGARAVIGIGLADAALVVRWLACAAPLRPGERGLALALAGGWALALAAAAAALARELPDARLALLLPLAAANGVLAFAAFASRRRVLPLAAVAGLSLASGIWFNPVAVGGARRLADHDLVQRIRAIDRSAGGATVWASFGSDVIGNLFRVAGVRAITGVQPVPQLALWRRIDPLGAARPIYDRYAHVTLVPARGGATGFRLISRDTVALRVDLEGPALRVLGVTHVLVPADGPECPGFDRARGFEPLGVVGRHRLYAVLDAPDAPAAP